MSVSKTVLKSQIIWQPILLSAVLGYLLAEVYFLTLLVNSLYFTESAANLTQLEVTGRLISGAGLGLSALIGLSMNKSLNRTGSVRRISIKLGCFVLVTIVGYVAMKELYLMMERHASKQIVHCSLIGNAANRLFSKGNLPEFHYFVSPEQQTQSSHKQLVRLYLPLHVCLNDSYMAKLQKSDVLQDELSLMLMETGLPEKLARPVVTIYQGFKDRIDDFRVVVEELDSHSNFIETRQKHVDDAVSEFSAFLATQSRFTRHDITRLTEVYQCSLSGLPDATTGPPEQRFMLAVSRCLTQLLRQRLPGLGEITRASDVYQLDHKIAHYWATQYINSPRDIPEDAFNLMRKSFALVFLPTYAVLVSTFIVFICLAAYLRTRFLIRARRMKKRINPVLNASLSPLVVVPFIWTAIFLWLPKTETEKVLFPQHTQSQWGRVIQVALRPLFYYYDASVTGFKHMNLPLMIGQVSAAQSQVSEENKQNTSVDLSGYYGLSICNGRCEDVLVEIDDNRQSGRVYYRQRQCATKLVFDKEELQHFSYFETAADNSECKFNRRWQFRHIEQAMEILLEEGQQVLHFSAQNLFI